MRSFSHGSTLTDDGLTLDLAPALTPSGLVEHPGFFHGFAAHPVVVTRSLLVLADIAATRYFRPVPVDLRDPILTANGDRLRAECFSACNGVLARLDLLEAGLDGGQIGHGTTNVDIGPAMRQALTRVPRGGLLHLDVGADRLRASTPAETVEERRVQMPDRWVRALGNAAELTQPLVEQFSVGAAAARRFVQTRPRAGAARGAKFAAEYIDRESSGHDIAYVTMTPSHGDAWVQLVRDLKLEPPRQLGYAVAWTTLALQACRGEGDPEPFTAEAEEHLSLAVEVHLPPHGALGDLLRLDLLPRERRLELCLAGLESAPRPSDRADWGRLLLDLAVTDDELRARADLLLGALASGEGSLLEGLGTRCAAALGDEYLPDLLVIAGAARTKKAAKALLSALASRPRPAETTELESLLADLLVRDADIAKATQRLCEAWGITPQAPEPETALLPWQPVPPTWQVPAFDPGPATAERLTELAAALGSFEDSLLAEQFVATLHAVVRRDPEEARLALAGVGDRYRLGLDVYAEWQRSLVRTSDNVADVRARDLGPRLAEVPAIVSLPSHDDLTIDPEDLLARLRQFDEAGIVVPAGDLYWALLRVDTSDITKDLISRARTIQAAVRFADGSVLTRGAHSPSGPGDQLTAGDALAQLLEHPLVDLWDDDRDHFIRADLAGQPGMAGWPVGMELCQGDAHYLLPGFPDFLIQAFYYPGAQKVPCRPPGAAVRCRVAPSSTCSASRSMRRTAPEPSRPPSTPGNAACCCPNASSRALCLTGWRPGPPPWRTSPRPGCSRCPGEYSMRCSPWLPPRPGCPPEPRSWWWRCRT